MNAETLGEISARNKKTSGADSMEIRNKKMFETIENKYVNKYHDQSELIDVFWPKFVEVEECILIQKEFRKKY
ncbi:hypothetical protein [Paenibacillus sp. IHBB 10380]|uniref:hypothetical protein n=1 Tax=Paenibacillus sp. IHBB 10380 TaxID=1566358 RepID=UPI0005CFBA6F|nr:hypothetical protein [Paenibacillus sp. IHBB 10380]AJS58994.1 hypothetical protein UB51_11530 [Paenibacillus sp. IHBB 10380]